MDHAFWVFSILTKSYLNNEKSFILFILYFLYRHSFIQDLFFVKDEKTKNFAEYRN